ncbi:MAG: MBL fold metallo-hydrolase [Acidobacteria bacterium]|nr:MBL fold metallo-hydrolase [Acidobacteriota bacterium]
MARRKGCGCASALLAVVLAAAAVVGYKYALPWWRRQPPKPSGGELQVHVLDVGQGDSILIISPAGKTMLIDAGDFGKDKVVRDALARYNVSHLDYFVATHAHADHIGGAAEVLKSVKTDNVIDNGVAPPEYTDTQAKATKAKVAKGGNAKGGKGAQPKSPPAPKLPRGAQLPTVKAYTDYLDAVKQSGAQHTTAEPGAKIDLGGGAFLTVLAPVAPPFTEDQMRGGGNAPNANSVVLRLQYGDFSMLFAGDAESVSEDRIMRSGAELQSKVLKVAHHGSKYATTEEFLKRVKPEAAIISDGEYNRYGHPAADVLSRLKAADARVFRTDLQGEITITTKGNEFSLREIKPAREAASDVYAGREGTKDDSERAGFIAYGDFGPPPKPKPEKKSGGK